MKAKYVSLLLIAAVLVFSVPMYDTSDALQTPSGDISWNTEDSINIKANSVETFEINVYNLSSASVHVHLASGSISDMNVSLSNNEFVLGPVGTAGDRISVTVTLHSDKYANEHTAVIPLTLTSFNMATEAGETSSTDLTVNVSSLYSSGSQINKIFGVFESPLPSPFDRVFATAAITFLLWMLISAAASSAVRITGQYTVERIASIKSKKKLVDREYFRRTWKYVFGIVIMYGMANTMAVLGIDGQYIGAFRDITDIVMILFAAMTFWHIYTTVANVLSFKISDGDEESSLKPLLLLLGRLVIILVTLIIILSIYGISLGSIVVAVGLGATGISFGAKTVITQFFCGIQNMILRTFRNGDKIRIGSDTTTLIIKEVGIMTTKCKNWSNEEMVYVPNSTLSDTKIVNLTKDNVFYKVYDYYTIGYSVDIGRAREIMVHCASADDGVIADGSFPMPDVRFSEVNRTEIVLRLAYTVVDHEDYGSISARIRMAIYKAFIEEDIDVPYSQYSVRLIGSEPRSEAGPQ